MAKLRPWPAKWPVGLRPDAERHTLASGQTFKAGDFVKKDVSDKIIDVGDDGGFWADGFWASGFWASGFWASVTDPDTIYGIAAENAEDVLESGYVIVYHFDQSVRIAMQGTRAPIDGDISTEYGIVQDSDGVYLVDTTETVNTRLTVTDVDTDRELYFVRILSANIQS